MSERGCLKQETVCRDLDPVAIKGRLQAKTSNTESSPTGEVRDVASAVRTYEKLSDLRLRFGCDDPAWHKALGLLSKATQSPGITALPEANVPGVELKKALPLITGRTDDKRLSERMDAACPAASTIAARIPRAEDEFERKDLLEQMAAARRNCARNADGASVGASVGTPLFFNFRVETALEYDFERKGFPVVLAEAWSARTPDGDVLVAGEEGASVVALGLPPFTVPAGSPGCRQVGCLLIPVPEADGRAMRKRFRGSEVQVAAVVAGYGDVPSDVNIWTKGPALIVRAVGMRIVSRQSPLTAWQSIQPLPGGSRSEKAYRWVALETGANYHAR
jgi:hypothetical protein